MLSHLAFWWRRKKLKIDFQNGGHGGRLWFSIWTILAIIDLQVTSTFAAKFRVSWPFCKGDEVQNRFLNGGNGNHLGFPIGVIIGFTLNFQDDGHGGGLGFLTEKIFAVFDLQVALILPAKFGVNWPFRFGEVQYIFSRWRPWRLSWISDQTYFSCFLFTGSLDISFYLQVALILPTKIRPRYFLPSFGSGEDVQNRLSR